MQDSTTVVEGIIEAPSHEEARVLPEKRKEIPPPEGLASREAPSPKKRKKTKANPAEPIHDNPEIVEDVEDGSEGSSKAIHEAVPLQQCMPFISIREPIKTTSKPVVVSSSDRKRKRVFEEEGKVYTRNIKAHKPDILFVNLGPSDMAAPFNKALCDSGSKDRK